MKKLITSFLTLIILLMVADDADAQRRRRSRDTQATTEEKTSFADKLNYEIRVGNVAFGGGFALDLKPTVNYKVNKYISAGVGYRLDYDFINGFPDDFSLFSHGPLAMARAKVTPTIYVQAEYTLFKFDRPNNNDIKQNFPSIGAGYVQGGGNWKYSIEGMFVANDLARNIFNNSIEFWFNFSKNF